MPWTCTVAAGRRSGFSSAEIQRGSWIWASAAMTNGELLGAWE